MDFLILRPLSPKTGYHFFEGGGGRGGLGGGQKFSLRRLQAVGKLILLSHNRRSNGNTAHSKFSVGGSNPGRPTVGGSGSAVFNRPGFEPPTKKTPVSCITIRPLLGLRRKVSPLLGAAFATDKKPKLCVSA